MCFTPALVLFVGVNLLQKNNHDQSFVFMLTYNSIAKGSLFLFLGWRGWKLSLLVPFPSVDIVREKSVNSITEGRVFSNRLALWVKLMHVYVLHPTHECVLHVPLSVSAATFFWRELRFFCGVVVKDQSFGNSVGLFQRRIAPKSAAFRPRILFVFPPS